MSRFSMQTVSIFSKPRRGRTTTFCRGKWLAQQHDFTLIDSFLEGFLHVGGTAEMLKLIMKCGRMGRSHRFAMNLKMKVIEEIVLKSLKKMRNFSHNSHHTYQNSGPDLTISGSYLH